MSKKERVAILHADLSSSSDSDVDDDGTDDAGGSSGGSGQDEGAAAAAAAGTKSPFDGVQLASLAGKGPDRGILQVERVAATDISPEDFVKRYVNRALPVVLTGAMEEWPAYAVRPRARPKVGAAQWPAVLCCLTRRSVLTGTLLVYRMPSGGGASRTWHGVSGRPRW